MKVINPGTEACRDTGRPGCLETPDPAFTMRFDEIGEGPILWCSHCGPYAQQLQAALETMSLPALMKVYEKIEVLAARREGEGELMRVTISSYGFAVGDLIMASPYRTRWQRFKHWCSVRLLRRRNPDLYYIASIEADTFGSELTLKEPPHEHV